MNNLRRPWDYGQLDQLARFIETKDGLDLYRALLPKCSFGGILPFQAAGSANCWFYCLL
jgi:hypothetical protein